MYLTVVCRVLLGLSKLIHFFVWNYAESIKRHHINLSFPGGQAPGIWQPVGWQKADDLFEGVCDILIIYAHALHATVPWIVFHTTTYPLGVSIYICPFQTFAQFLNTLLHVICDIFATPFSQLTQFCPPPLSVWYPRRRVRHYLMFESVRKIISFSPTTDTRSLVHRMCTLIARPSAVLFGYFTSTVYDVTLTVWENIYWPGCGTVNMNVKCDVWGSHNGVGEDSESSGIWRRGNVSQRIILSVVIQFTLNGCKTWSGLSWLRMWSICERHE